ncbi:DUF4097 domain-containing protein [Candidatus Zixiibacteriota bacterium]
MRPEYSIQFKHLASSISLAVLLVLSLSAGATAQQKVNETKAASATGLVKINNFAGSVKVIAWNRNEVSVEGTLGEGTKRLEFEATSNEVTIRVVLPDEEERRAQGIRNIEGTELEIRVPAGSNLEIETLSADITSSGVTGDLRFNSLSGNVEVGGTASDVYVKTLSGDITISNRQGGISAGTMSGTIQIEEAVGAIKASSLSGDIHVTGSSIEDADINSTSGDIRYRGGMSRDAILVVENFSGEITLVLPSDISADFDISTYSGDIKNALGPQAERRSRFGPGKDLTFVTGSGDARVRVKTFSGDVSIEK